MEPLIPVGFFCKSLILKFGQQWKEIANGGNSLSRRFSWGINSGNDFCGLRSLSSSDISDLCGREDIPNAPKNGFYRRRTLSGGVVGVSAFSFPSLGGRNRR